MMFIASDVIMMIKDEPGVYLLGWFLKGKGYGLRLLNSGQNLAVSTLKEPTV